MCHNGRKSDLIATGQGHTLWGAAPAAEEEVCGDCTVCRTVPGLDGAACGRVSKALC